MKKIQVLGTGCQKCHQLEENARTAAAEVGGGCEVEKISDLKEIMKFGVMITPALALDGEIKATGKVLSVEEILQLL